jgi:DNA-binding protein H-NS
MRIVMERKDLASIPTDELWTLHEKIAATLVAKLKAEIKAIDNRLRQLNGPIQTKQSTKKPSRRPYPIVLPKFQNPNQPSQTWAGRGKRPRWLTAYLRSGKRIDDFRIERVAA